MAITKVDIPESKKVNGLGPIKMDRLGKVVLLAGKNGAGKSRILNRIEAEHGHKKRHDQNFLTNFNRFEELLKRIGPVPSNDFGSIQELENWLSQWLPIPRQFSERKDELSFTQVKNTLTNTINERVRINMYENDDFTNNSRCFAFVPKSLDLKDSSTLTKTELKSRAESLKKVGINNAPGSTYASIQRLQDLNMEATHPSNINDLEINQAVIAEYKRLESSIKMLFGTTLGRNRDGDATLFGFPLGSSKLSDGQKILLQFCLALHYQEANLKDLILIMDEPENHLHPSVLIEVLDRIEKVLTTGQIWIATHSIPLLAHYDPSQIWFVEDGQVTHAGKIPEKVLSSLLGNESEIAKLHDFIGLPAQFATSRYAFESLFEPPVVMTGARDKQSLQIRGVLKSLLIDGGKLRILDYGAGKGRIISNLRDQDIENAEELIQQIDYIAYDEYENDRLDCTRAITGVYGNADNRYYNKISDLKSDYNEGKFHVVLMCNVLHEIDPNIWLSLFGKSGRITKLLSDNGCLLIVEDHQMPIGEKAYQKGFLVMDTPSLKKLFKINECENGFSVSKDEIGRLKAHMIPRACLERMDAESRTEAVEETSETALEQIKRIREEEKNYTNGKLHGFWVQQFANAQLNLIEWKNN